MSSKIIILLCMVTVAVAVPAQPGFGGWAGAYGGGGGWGGAGGGWGGAGAANPWIPPWVAAAPWFPQWTPCTTIGASCVDCNTKLVCTKIGGLQSPCSDPTLPYCNLGACSAEPSAECAPIPAVPANTAA